MQHLRELKATDLQGLSPHAVAELAQQMLAHIQHQSQHLQQQSQRIERQAHELKFKDAKLQKVLFELARLKAWKFGAKTEAMNAEQRRLFEETMAEDEAALQAQLEQLQKQQQAEPPKPVADGDRAPRKPRREQLPEHLRREDHVHEPSDTRCPSPDCGRPMVRVGEDISEKLDIVPAEFFVQRHIYGKWACRCCQCLVQEPAVPQIIDGGIMATGLIAHTVTSHFVDHLPYYRLETINARSGVHTPRSTLAQTGGRVGAAMEPLYDPQRRFVLQSSVLHADETPVAMLDPGRGKTKRAYVWTYARGGFNSIPGVVYEFCLGRGAQYPIAFLQGDDGFGAPAPCSGTLVRDEYSAYKQVVDSHPGRIAAGCLAHARRHFHELAKAGTSEVANEALRRIAAIYRAEREFANLASEERLQMRQAVTLPMWEELHLWLRLERTRVPDGGATAKALNYSLNAWDALTRNLVDGDVPVDNNHCKNQIRPWAMGRRAWLFAGSELAGQRAAVVMSLVQSAKLCGHDPYAYLKDVLERLPTHMASRIDDLLPHRWQPLV